MGGRLPTTQIIIHIKCNAKSRWCRRSSVIGLGADQNFHKAYCQSLAFGLDEHNPGFRRAACLARIWFIKSFIIMVECLCVCVVHSQDYS